MSTARVLSLEETESRVCDIAAKQLGLRRTAVHPGLRLIQDLHCDSLDLVDLLMSIEDALDVSLPDDAADPAYKAVFTRDPFRLRDLAELAYLRHGTGPVEQTRSRKHVAATGSATSGSHLTAFTQLGGRLECDAEPASLFEPLAPANGSAVTFRRRTDGMICVALPGGDVVLGDDDDSTAGGDARPTHRARLDPFLIDREPVSTTAYCRFLNSIGRVEPSVHETWFMLPDTDLRRRPHEVVRFGADGTWRPAPGTEHKPMVLVSWYGACAYALWANGRDWRRFDTEDGEFLPSEAQWEYAARGAEPRRFPWGDDEPDAHRMRYARHTRGQTYAPHTLPMADVNDRLGVSPFGLHHMAGNVWQWCRDWYAEDFYGTPEASGANPLNARPSRVRSERGGSWIGSAELCRSSYRRGRVPSAKGRCLGFRCVGPAAETWPRKRGR